MLARSNRRSFLRQAAMGSLGLVILKDSRSARTYAANERLDIALIGCGGRGEWFATTVNNWGNLAYLCDVDDERCRVALKLHPKVTRYYDFRKMLDEAADKVDGVIIAVPDHTHAVCCAAVMKAGKPVYCEKPLTRTLHEARALAEMARRLKVITQMGNQGGYNTRAINLIRAGALGDVREVHMFNTGGGPGPRQKPTDTPEVPASLKWDLWLGPAADRPYHPVWMRGGWREFRTSVLGNWGPHTMATTYKALKVDTLWEPPKEKDAPHPVIKVTGECSELCTESFPRWEVVHWDLPAREGMPPARLNWYNGGNAYRPMVEELLGRKLDWGEAGGQWTDWQGNLLVGTRGKMYTRKHGCVDVQLLPKEQFENVPEPPNSLPQPLGKPAEQGWTEAIKGGPAPQSSFDGFAGPFTEFYLLGNVATLFPGVTLEYDPIEMKITNNKEADAALRCEYRKGWTL